MDKEQALHKFWSSFGLTAYDENTVPDDALTINKGKYLTYNVATASLDEPTPLYANLWYKSSSWAEITAKANEIAGKIGLVGSFTDYDGGTLWITRGRPFSQRMPDDDDTIRRIYVNVTAEFISAD
jgi:hypothetical protein